MPQNTSRQRNCCTKICLTAASLLALGGCDRADSVSKNTASQERIETDFHLEGFERYQDEREIEKLAPSDPVASWREIFAAELVVSDPDYALDTFRSMSQFIDDPLLLYEIQSHLVSVLHTVYPKPWRHMAEVSDIVLSRFLANQAAIIRDPMGFTSLLWTTAVYFGASGNTEKMLEINEFIANFDHEAISDEMRRNAIGYNALVRRASGDGARAAADFERTIQFYLDAGETPPMTLRVNAIVMPAQAGYTVENAGERFHELWLEALPDRNWDAVYVGEHLGHHLRAAGDLHAALQVHMEMLDLYRTNTDQVAEGWAALGRDFDRQYWNELVRTMDIASHAREYETAYLLAMEIAERYDTPGNDLGRTRAEGYARMLGIPHDPPPYADPSAPH